jgi:dihydrofolate synthase/folylpolyglutamate synthase
MNYKECVDYIQNAALYGSKKVNLDGIARLLSRLGNPHYSLKCVHVAGTNGKGSVCAMTESVLRQSGYKTGLFTSPYLETFTERIRINGANISENDFERIANSVISEAKKIVEEGFVHPTFFELVTACAFTCFKKSKVDIAVIEAGVGGLNDSTNIIDPLISVITNIGLDHIQVLGNTIEEIARKKAGIIKPGCPVVVYPQENSLAYTELLMESRRQSAPLYSASDAKILIKASGIDGQKFSISYQGIDADIEIPLLGKHQILNAATAFIALVVLKQLLGLDKITAKSILSGFKNAKWPGRLEIVHAKNPLTIIDGAHNKQAAHSLKQELSQLIVNQKCILLVGIMSTKDAEGIIEELSDIAIAAVATSPAPPKSIPAEELKEILEEKISLVYADEDVEFALKHAAQLAQKENVPLIAAGSLYLAGKVRSLILNLD